MPNTRKRVLARDRISIIADETGLEERFVRQVIIRLKADGLIATSRPIAPEMTPGDLAAILIALAAPLPGRATETLKALAMLPRSSGFGADVAIDELAAIIKAAAGRDGKIDHRNGDILIGVTSPSVSVRAKLFTGDPKSATYKTADHYSGAVTYFMYPMGVVSRIARQLIEV